MTSTIDLEPLDDHAQVTPDEHQTPLLSAAYRWATTGMVGLIFLAAFENLAVTTVMPTVVADLDGRAWFSVAFSASLAASVVGMVAGGLWADRTGPAAPLLAAVGTFAAGLLLAGLAPAIEVFVAARFLQGLGSGALVVALYVLVAEVFAAIDHPRIFAAFAAAWVVPSLVGPSLAGLVAESLGWRWVFLGVVVIAALATLTLRPSMRSSRARPRADAPTRARIGRIGWAVLASATVVVVDLAARAGGIVGGGVAVAAVLATLAAVRPLLPRGTLRLVRGLPAVIALRGLVAATFFSSEIYLPYLLQERYDVTPALAGITLTCGAIGWASASQVQSRLGARLGHVTALRAGSALLASGVVATLVATALQLPAAVLALTWILAASGMGLSYPRFSALVLAASAAGEQGGNTSSMSVADALGAATAIALTGLAFTGVGAPSELAPFLAALGLGAALGVAAVAVSRRAE